MKRQRQDTEDGVQIPCFVAASLVWKVKGCRVMHTIRLLKVWPWIYYAALLYTYSVGR